MALALVSTACGGADSSDTDAAAATATQVADVASADGGTNEAAGAGPVTTDDSDLPTLELNSGAISGTDDAPGAEAKPLAEAETEQTTVGADGLVQGQGVTDASIRLAFVLNDTNPDTEGFLFAQRAYWNAVNANGGIAGRTIDLAVTNSSGSASDHTQAVAGIAAGDGAALMIGGIDSLAGTTAVAADLVRTNLVALPLTAWSGWTDPVLGANLLEVQASDCAQAINSMSYLSDRSGDRVAIVSSPGQPFTDAVAGARVAVEHDGLELVVDAAGALTADADLTPLLDQLAATAPNAVWLAADADIAVTFVAAARARGFLGRFGGISQSYDPQLLADHGDDLSGYLVAVPHAMWGDNTESGMQQLAAALDSENPFATIDPIHINSWLFAMATHQAMDRAVELNTLTRTAVVEATKTLKVGFEALAPNQQWTTTREFVSVGTYLYEADLSFDGSGSVSDADAASGYTLRKGPFTADAALVWTPETCAQP